MTANHVSEPLMHFCRDLGKNIKEASMTADEQARVEVIAGVVGELTGEYHEVCQAVAKRIIAADPATAYITKLEEELVAAKAKLVEWMIFDAT